VLCFFNSAVLWLLIHAEFLAIVLVLVYVGAVMVLFLFVVMMLDINIEQLREGFARNAPLGGLIALIMVVELAYVLWVRRLGIELPGPVAEAAQGASNTAEIGAVLYTEYVYPFQLAAAVLLIAIVAAITLTLRRRPGLKVQDVSAQVAVDAADRVRLVSMHYLLLAGILFAIAVAGIFINRKNVILLLMCIELMLLAVNFNFVAFSRFLGDLDGQVFVFFILTVAAAEAAIGLAILVVLFRQRRSINVEELDAMKG
jgi:NADH-quinone oxidoreductase subunit J